jgi:hypothetical protein
VLKQGLENACRVVSTVRAEESSQGEASSTSGGSMATFLVKVIHSEMPLLGGNNTLSFSIRVFIRLHCFITYLITQQATQKTEELEQAIEKVWHLFVMQFGIGKSNFLCQFSALVFARQFSFTPLDWIRL